MIQATQEAGIRQQWLNERRKSIGSSDAATLWGVNPFQSPLQLWQDKLGLVDHGEETEAMRFGTLLQPVVAEAFQRETGRPVRRNDGDKLAVMRDLPIAAATVDGWQHRGSVEGVLELKTTNAYARADWQENAPAYYRIQVQHQLMVTGLPFASIACLIGGQEFIWLDVERDEAFIQQHRRRVEAFWRNHIETETPPTPNADDRDALLRMFPQEVAGKIIELPALFVDLDAELAEVAAERKRLTEREDEIKNLIRAELGDAEAGIVPGTGFMFKNKLETRKAHQVAESAARVLRRVKAK